MKQITGGNALRLSNQIAAAWRPEMLGLSRQLAEIARLQRPDLSGLRIAVEPLQEAAAEAVSGAPEEDESAEGASVGWWLASRPLSTKIALLVDALNFLDAAKAYLEATSAGDVPGSVLSASRMCLSMVVLLLFWLQESDDSGE